MLKSQIESLRDQPEKWALRCALVAACCYMYMRSGAPQSGYETVVATLALGAAALVFEFVGAKRATLGWINRKPVAIIGWGAVWLAAFAYAGNNWLGVASDGEDKKAGVQRAAYVTETSNTDELKAAKIDRDRAQARLAWMQTAVNGQPVRSVEAADADMSAAKADRMWRATGECRDTSSKREKDFCAKFSGYRAEKALATEKLTLQAELDKARTAVAGYEARVVGKTALATSDKRSDLRFYTRYAGLTDEIAQDVQALLKILVVSAFVTFSAVLMTLDAHKDTPRQPWVDWRRITQWLRGLWSTDPPKIIDRVVMGHVIRSESGGLQTIATEVKST